MFLRQKKAITFLEIIIAVTVMAIAMIPLFGMLSRQTVETDKNASQAFAINKATEVLNALLDNISFVALREGNPGYIRVDDLDSDKFSDLNDAWAKKMATMLFNSDKKEANGYPCRGIIKDSKGISYLIHLRVEDVVSTTKHSKPERMKIGEDYPSTNPLEFPEQAEVAFTFLKNPSLISSSEFSQDFAEDSEETGKPLTELEIGGNGVSESPKNFYKDEGLESLKNATKYGFINPTAERYTAKMVMSRLPYQTDDAFAWCPFKRLIVQVQWNIEPHYYSEPENENGNIQRVHLMAIKGDIDS